MGTPPEAPPPPGPAGGAVRSAAGGPVRVPLRPRRAGPLPRPVGVRGGPRRGWRARRPPAPLLGSAGGLPLGAGGRLTPLVGGRGPNPPILSAFSGVGQSKKGGGCGGKAVSLWDPPPVRPLRPARRRAFLGQGGELPVWRLDESLVLVCLFGPSNLNQQNSRFSHWGQEPLGSSTVAHIQTSTRAHAHIHRLPCAISTSYHGKPSSWETTLHLLCPLKCPHRDLSPTTVCQFFFRLSRIFEKANFPSRKNCTYFFQDSYPRMRRK